MNGDNPGTTKLGQHGGRRVKGQVAHRSLRLSGTTKAYILARLQRDGLVAAIAGRKTTAFAVAVQLGWAKRPRLVCQQQQDDASPPRPISIGALIG
jgi:hypothetical protein